jgi:hypothetical protein
MSEETPVLFPYGASNFEEVVTSGCVYVDKTNFIELLEKKNERRCVFLRPRRFGKSLFLSVLEYYYDVKRKVKFEQLFSKYYIGKNPTKNANAYRILKFDFSGIDTKDAKSTYRGFLEKVRITVKGFCEANITDEKQISFIIAQQTPELIIDSLFSVCSTFSVPIYLLIDEYDHFTNEILLRNLSEFKTSVAENGYVRKFYEVIKTATQAGIVQRFFITGVSPITLDALTSGFNITTNLSLEKDFQEMMGFAESDVKNLLFSVLKDRDSGEEIMEILRKYYNGYRFSLKAKNSVYNSDMVLYFLKHFADENEFPREMLDPNIAPDYGKLKMIFERLNWTENTEVLNEVLHNGAIKSRLLQIFSFETDDLGQEAFVSFLFYLGNLTIKGEDEFGETSFVIPNKVIEDLYWQYYASLLQKINNLSLTKDKVIPSVRTMAGGNLEPFFALVSAALKELSNRDFQQFDEKYVKMLVMAFAVQSDIFFVQSERETKNGGYVDLEFDIQPRNRHRPHFQYVFEFKYLKKSEADLLKNTQIEAENQLKNYLQNDDILKNKVKLLAYTVVVVKDEIFLTKIDA